MQKQTFGKEERLCSKKKIDRLFAEGNSFLIYPFRVTHLFAIENQEEYPIQVLISVSKKKIKKAISRNLIKRRIREGYRKNKSGFSSFLQNKNLNCDMAIVYVASEIIEYSEIEQKIILILQRLQTEYEKSIG
jgi:ribonuclease P protein component